MQKKLGRYIWTLRQIEAVKERLNNETGNSINDEITDNSVDGEGASDGSVDGDGLQASQDTLRKLQSKLQDEFGNIDSEVLVLTKQVCLLSAINFIISILTGKYCNFIDEKLWDFYYNR